MADFLLTGRVNTAQIVKDITNAVKTANERLKDIKVTINTKEARDKIQSLRNLMSKEIKIDINTRDARNKIAALKKEIEAATAGFKTGIAGSSVPGSQSQGKQTTTSAAQQASAFSGASQSVQRQIDLLKTLGTQSGKTAGSINNLRSSTTKLDNAVFSAGSSIGGPLAKGLGVSDDLFKSFGVNVFLSTVRLSAFAAAGALVFGVGRAMKEAIAQTIKLDSALTSINKVLNLTDGQLSNFRNELIKTAKESSTSVEKVTEATVVFAQQGLNAREIIEAVRASLLAVNASGVTFNEAVELLTVSVNSFGKSFSDSTTIIDRLSTIADITAASVSDLTTIIARSGSTAEAAGISLEQLASIGAVVRESTRLSAETVGAAFKTIFVNVQSNEEVLNRFGIATRDFGGNFLGVSRILEIAAQKFSSLNEEQKISLASLLTGKRRTTELIAILNGFSKASDIQRQALASSGTATEKQTKQLETLASRIEHVGVQFTELTNIISEAGGKGILKGIVEVFSTTLTLVNNFTSALASIPGLIPAAALVAVFKLLVPPINKSIAGIRLLAQEHFSAGKAARAAAEETLTSLRKIEEEEFKLLEMEKERNRLKNTRTGAIVDATNPLTGASQQRFNVTQITSNDLASQENLNKVIRIRESELKKINKQVENLTPLLNREISAQALMSSATFKTAKTNELIEKSKAKILVLQERINELLAVEATVTAQNVAANKSFIAAREEQLAVSKQNLLLTSVFVGSIISSISTEIRKTQEATGAVSIFARGLEGVADAATEGALAATLLEGAFGAAAGPIGAVIAGVKILTTIVEIAEAKAAETANKFKIARDVTNEIVSNQRQTASLQQQILSLGIGTSEDLEKRNDLVKQFASSVESTLNSIKERTGNKFLFVPPADVIASDVEEAVNHGIDLSKLPVIQLRTKILTDELDKQLALLRGTLSEFGKQVQVGLLDRFKNVGKGLFEDLISAPTSASDFVKKGEQISSLILAGVGNITPILFEKLFPKADLANELASFSNDLASKIGSALDPRAVLERTRTELKAELDKTREEISKFDAGGVPENVQQTFDATVQKINAVEGALAKYNTTIKQNALVLIEQARNNLGNVQGLNELQVAEVLQTKTIELLGEEFKKVGEKGQQAFKEVSDAVIKFLSSNKVEAAGTLFSRTVNIIIASLDRLAERQKTDRLILDTSMAIDSLKAFNQVSKNGTEIIDSLEKQLVDAQVRVESLSKTQNLLLDSVSKSATALGNFADQLKRSGEVGTDKLGKGNEAAKAFLADLESLKELKSVKLIPGTKESEESLSKIASLIFLLEGRIENLSKKADEALPGGDQTLFKQLVSNYNTLLSKLKDVATGVKDINDVSKELGQATVDVKVGKVNLDFRQKEIEIDAKIKAVEVDVDRKLLAVDLEKKIADIAHDIKGKTLEFVADINMDKAIEKVEASNDRFRITSILDVNLRGIEDAFKREIDLAKQVRDSKIVFIEQEKQIELQGLEDIHAQKVAEINASSDSSAKKTADLAKLNAQFVKDKASLENKFAKEKFDNELSLAKTLADASFTLEKNKIDKLSTAFEQAVDEINNIKSNIGQTENDIVSQLQSVGAAQDTLNQAFFKFGDAVADFNQKIVDARFQAFQATTSLQEFAKGLSFKDKLNALSSLLAQSLRLIGGSEQRILQIRRQFTEETINIIKDQVTELRSIGEQGFTATGTELLNRQIARSVGEAIKSSPEVARNFAAAAGNEQLSRDLIAVAKEQAKLGDTGLLDILSQAGLDILGVSGNIEDLTNKIIDQGKIQSDLLIKLSEIDTEQLNQARGALVTAQQQLVGDKERLANLQGLLAAQKQRMVDAASQAQFIGKKLNEARAAIDESKIAIVNAILRQAQENASLSTGAQAIQNAASSNVSGTNRTDEQLRQANLTDALSGPFSTGLFAPGTSAGNGNIFTGGIDVLEGLNVTAEQTGFSLEDFIKNLDAGDLGIQQLQTTVGTLNEAFGQLQISIDDLRNRTHAGTPSIFTNPGIGINRASGSLTSAESMALLMAARREKSMMPGGAKLGVFNTSETVLTRRQANLLLGTRPRAGVTSAAEGNIGEGGISELIPLLRDLLDKMRSGSSDKLDVNLTVDGTRTLNIQGVGNISTEIAKSVQAAIGNLATKDELNAVVRILNDAIIRKLRERGILGATLT